MTMMNSRRALRATVAAAALYALMPAVTHAQIAQFGDPPPDPNPRSARMGVERLPDASGKEEVATLCSRCHNLERIANQRRTERQWEALVPFMLGRLERAPRAEQMRAATTYLTEHWSRPETTAEAALADPLREPDAAMPLAEARDLSGAWMTTTWYTMLNMGPADGLPIRPRLPQHRRPQERPHRGVESVGQRKIERLDDLQRPTNELPFSGPAGL